MSEQYEISLTTSFCEAFALPMHDGVSAKAADYFSLAALTRRFRKMITRLHIDNFRGIRDLTMTGLKRVNLIAGANNTGKTALLEAIYAVMEPEKAFTEPMQESVAQPSLRAAFRNTAHITEPYENFWKWMFSEVDLTQKVRIEASWSNQHVLISEVQSPSHYSDVGAFQYRRLETLNGLFPAFFPTPRPALANTRIFSTMPSDPVREAVDYNRVVLKKGGEERVEKLLKSVESRLGKLRALQTGTRPLIYADIGMRELIPSTQLGQGFSRLLDIFSEIVAAESRLLLIDEIENGIHHGVMKEVWRGLAAAAETEGVQVFATTHSWECIRAAHECFAETPDYDFALHRIERGADGIKLVTYDRESLTAAINHELEVR